MPASRQSWLWTMAAGLEPFIPRVPGSASIRVPMSDVLVAAILRVPGRRFRRLQSRAHERQCCRWNPSGFQGVAVAPSLACPCSDAWRWGLRTPPRRRARPSRGIPVRGAAPSPSCSRVRRPARVGTDLIPLRLRGCVWRDNASTRLPGSCGSKIAARAALAPPTTGMARRRWPPPARRRETLPARPGPVPR